MATEPRQHIIAMQTRLLWAHKQGMEFPPYILKALRESVDLYRERLERGLKFA